MSSRQTAYGPLPFTLDDSRFCYIEVNWRKTCYIHDNYITSCLPIAVGMEKLAVIIRVSSAFLISSAGLTVIYLSALSLSALDSCPTCY